MELPITERKKVLAEQAEELSYSATRKERISRQGGRIYDYDSEDNAPSSADSDKPVGEERSRTEDL
jgi:hypothetical protein